METTQDSLIPYDEIVQEALRAVVGRVLGQIGSSGLPGEHHFYITFKTRAPGVDIPDHLMEKFPDEMTIVLQNRFWDLEVNDDGFQVGLSFNQLQFQVGEFDDETGQTEHAENDPSETTAIKGSDDGSNVVTVDFGKKN